MIAWFILNALCCLVIGGLLAQQLRPAKRRADRTPAEQVEAMRNLIAFMLVSAFIGALLTLTFKAIPEQNKDLLTYMLGQLSGMATMALGFYFTTKAGQDAVDAKRVETTGKLADAITETAKTATAVSGGTEGDPNALKSGDTVTVDKAPDA